ncbi:hypothetical protein HanPI659440_Chr05g0207101 [Helianthus annuus]|nr:hypothetical protein HanPI659440_Chr05g0207101 [Helianthus annuus]
MPYTFRVSLFTLCVIGGSTCRVPMYSEAKLAFYIYLWYPKTMVKFIIQVLWGKYTDSFKCIQIMFILFFFRLFQGTTYVYD